MSNNTNASMIDRLYAVPDPATRELCRDAADYIQAMESRKTYWYDARTELAKTLIPSIRRMRTEGMSYPGAFLVDGDINGNIGMHNWHAILDEIIWALEMLVCDKMPTTAEHYRMRVGCLLLGKWLPDLWD